MSIQTHVAEDLEQLLGFAEEDEKIFHQQFGGFLAGAVGGTRSGILVFEEFSIQTSCHPDAEKSLLAYSRNETFIDAARACLENQRVRSLLQSRIEVFSPASHAPPDDQTSDRVNHGRNNPPSELLADSECHFFVPALKCTEHRLVIWIEVPIHGHQDRLAKALRLEDLSLLSLSRKHFESNSQLNEEIQSLSGQVEHTNQLLFESREITTDAKQLVALSEQISKHLEKEKSGFQLANELKVFLRVDRVTILDIVGKAHRVISVSGLPVIDRRANVIRATEQMVKSVGVADRPVFFEGDLSEFPESTHEQIGAFLDESMATGFAVLPLIELLEEIYESEEQSLIEVVNPTRTHYRKITGTIVAEKMSMPIDPEMIEELWSKARVIVSNQHNNSKRYSELPLLPLQILLKNGAALYRGHTKRVAFAITAAILLPILLASIIPAEFRVRCEGVLKPARLTTVYSPEEATVKQIRVKEGQQVANGELLVQLENLELEKKLTEAKGELAVLLAKQKSNLHRRAVLLPGKQDERKEQVAKLAIEGADLQVQIDDTRRIVSLLEHRNDKLAILAPFDGEVIGWNIDRKLLNRPLESGVNLFAISPHDGQWIVELKVPDKRAGYIRSAFYNSENNKLPIDFTMVSRPDKVFDATLVHVNPGLEEDTDLGYVLPMEAVPITALPEKLRSGTPVIAKVGCGTRSLLYCKCYEFLDWINRILFEYVA